ncbi:MAG: hypothetical protein ACP5GX_07950 [Anaerolineae bacterium]
MANWIRSAVLADGESDVCLVPLRKGVTSDSVPSKLLTIAAAGCP